MDRQASSGREIRQKIHLCQTPLVALIPKASPMRMDQISNCYIHDLEIRNFVLDGILISWSGPVMVRDSLFEAIWSHDNGRTGMSITGNARSLRFVDCWMDRNGAWGFDIEPTFSQMPIQDIHFVNCRFSGSGPAGFAIAPLD